MRTILFSKRRIDFSEPADWVLLRSIRETQLIDKRSSLLVLLFIILLSAVPVWAQPPPDDPAFTFELVSEPEGYFIPGDEVRFAFLPVENRTVTDSFTLAVKLPPGLILTDAFWDQRNDVATRRLGPPTNAEAFPVSITTQIDEGYKGKTLTVGGFLKDQPDDPQSVSISVAEVLSSATDTCFLARDSSGGQIRTILATRRKLTAQLRGPIDLSPTAPVRVSPQPNNIFALWADMKRAKQQGSALHYTLSSDNSEDYPLRYSPEEGVTSTIDFAARGRPGDSLQVSVRTLKDRPLRSITLTDETGEILDFVTDVSAYDLKVVQDTTSLDRTLHLRARRLFGIFPRRQYVLIDAERRPAQRELYRSDGQGDELSADIRALLPDTCAGNFDVRLETVGTRQKQWVATDTLLFQAADAAASVVGRRNPIGSRSGQIEIKVPVRLDLGEPETRDELYAIAYWVGVGVRAIESYDDLAEEIPLDWTQPGVSSPLAAYGLGYPVVLPDLGASEAIVRKHRVQYDFVDKDSRVVISRGMQRPNYGFLKGEAISKLGDPVRDPVLGKDVLRFYLDYQTRNDVNTYPIRLHVVGFYRVSSLVDTWGEVKH